MRPVEDLQNSVQSLREFLQTCSGNTVRGRRLLACLQCIEHAWGRASPRLYSWGIVPDRKLGELQGAIGALTEINVDSSHPVQSLVTKTDAVVALLDRPLYSAYVKTPWYHFRSAYDGVSDGEALLVDEGFRAHRAQCFRAAVVLLWAAGVFRLRDYVDGQFGIANFKAHSDALAQAQGKPWDRFTRKFQVDNRDDLDDVPDAHLLATLFHARVLQRHEYEVLDDCRNLRNRCAHPRLLIITEHQSMSAADLILRTIFENPDLR